MNREIERMFDYAREELLGQPIERLVPTRFSGGHPAYRMQFLRDPRTRSMGVGRDLFGLRKNGSEVPLEIGLTPVVTEEGMFVLAAVVDISERKRLEEDQRALSERLRQSQKMEAVGTLAGGIAHDFNNLLGSILGYAELIGGAVKDKPQVLKDLAELNAAAMRGRRLVERILSFSRRQEAERKPLDLAEIVREVRHLLRATLPTGIELTLQVTEPIPRVMADGTSVHQVLMNLATNAAQAMPGGGKLEFVVAPTYLRDSQARAIPGIREGHYVLLAVRDSGVGMDDATRARAFEPFFTTKPLGSGTGLGLAMVHGIMQDHEGAVQLESTPGTGTSVNCLFPALEAADPEPDTTAPHEIPEGQGQRILLVDDEASLLKASERRLIQLNYDVTISSSPTEALELLTRAKEPFDLLITDLSMPVMSGVDLAVRAMQLRPGFPVLLLTGYADEDAEKALLSSGIRRVLRKPVLLDELATSVQALLRPAGPAE